MVRLYVEWTECNNERLSLISKDLNWVYKAEGNKTIAPSAIPQADTVIESSKTSTAENLLDTLAAEIQAVASSSDNSSFVMTVTTVDGIYLFYLQVGQEFGYSVINFTSFVITYREVSDITALLETLFNEHEIIELEFSVN